MPRWHARIKITSVVATPVVVPLRTTWSPPGADATRHILRAGTNVGLVGLGEAAPHVALDDLAAAAQRVAGQCLDDLPQAHLPIDRPQAYAAIELLVYDILGQARKMPVYQLLGGRVRDAVAARVPLPGPPDAVAMLARRAVHGGFSAVQLSCPDLHLAAAQVAQMRPLAGDLRVYLHAESKWGTGAQTMQTLREVAAAGVEAVCDPWPLQQSPASAPPQPRVVHTVCEASWREALHAEVGGYELRSGLAAAVRFADMAQVWNRTCALAGDIDLGVLEVARLHACAAAEACCLPSDVHGRFLREHDLLSEPLRMSHGSFLVPQVPGLGVQLSPDALQRYRSGPDVELVRI